MKIDTELKSFLNGIRQVIFQKNSFFGLFQNLVYSSKFGNKSSNLLSR